MTPAITTELDRLLEEADWKARRAERRTNLSRGVFDAHRRTALAEGNLHPLKRARLMFRGEGLSRAELAERALVGESTIADLEAGKPGSDQTWLRLARALSVGRKKIDPTYVYTG